MTKEEAIKLKDGTRLILTQTGPDWEEDRGSSGVCVKIGNRLVEADIERPNDENIWYPYYSIDEMNEVGYEFEIEKEDEFFNFDVVINIEKKNAIKDLRNELCQIIFEGEGTALGKSITIERLKDVLDYIKWCEETIDD